MTRTGRAVFIMASGRAVGQAEGDCVEKAISCLHAFAGFDHPFVDLGLSTAIAGRAEAEFVYFDRSVLRKYAHA